MRIIKPKKFFVVVLIVGWVLTLGFHITNSWKIYQVFGQDPNNWKPSESPHISYQISPNEKVIGVPFLLTCQYDQAFSDFRFYVHTDDSSISEVVIQSLDVTYGTSKPERISENQTCKFENMMTAGPMRVNVSGKDFEFSFVEPKSIRNSNKMKVLIKYAFKRTNGELEEFVIENEREYRRRTEFRSYWMAIFEGIGTGGV